MKGRRGGERTGGEKDEAEEGGQQGGEVAREEGQRRKRRKESEKRGGAAPVRSCGLVSKSTMTCHGQHHLMARESRKSRGMQHKVYRSAARGSGCSHTHPHTNGWCTAKHNAHAPEVAMMIPAKSGFTPESTTQARIHGRLLNMNADKNNTHTAQFKHKHTPDSTSRRRFSLTNTSNMTAMWPNGPSSAAKCVGARVCVLRPYGHTRCRDVRTRHRSAQKKQADTHAGAPRTQI